MCIGEQRIGHQSRRNNGKIEKQAENIERGMARQCKVPLKEAKHTPCLKSIKQRLKSRRDAGGSNHATSSNLLIPISIFPSLERLIFETILSSLNTTHENGVHGTTGVDQSLHMDLQPALLQHRTTWSSPIKSCGEGNRFCQVSF